MGAQDTVTIHMYTGENKGCNIFNRIRRYLAMHGRWKTKS